MSAQRTITEVLALGVTVEDDLDAIAADMIAAIRAMPVEDQAELIRGTVDHLAGLVRVQGDWRKP